MKRLLLSSVALFGLSTVVMAADLPRRQAPPPVFTPVPVFTWTGFYIGVNAGYGFADTDSNERVFLPAGSVVGSAGTNGVLRFADNGGDDDGGFVGGGQIGFNYQVGTFVFGVEADFQYADLGGDNGRDNARYEFTGTPGLAFSPPAATVSRNGTSSLETFGTVRGRLGFAFDRTLIYATGGFAYGFSDGGDEFCRFISGGCSGGDDTRYGYTVGGGLEYAFTNNVTAKIEGLYVNLDESERRGRATYDLGQNRVFLANDNNGGGSDFFVVRAGLNFKFSGLGGY